MVGLSVALHDTSTIAQISDSGDSEDDLSISYHYEAPIAVVNDDFLCLTEPPVKQLRGLRHLRLHVHHATYDHAFGWLITRLRRVFTVDISGPRLSSLMLATLRSTFCPGAAISAGRKLRTIAVAQARSACNGDLHGTALLSAVLSIVDRLPLSTHQVDFSGRRIDVEASLHDPKATLMDTDRLYGALFKLGDGSDVSASKVYGPRTIRWRLRDEEVMVLQAKLGLSREEMVTVSEEELLQKLREVGAVRSS